MQRKNVTGDEEAGPDEFDDILRANTGKTLSTRLGNSPDMIAKKQKAARVTKKEGDGLKQTKLNFKKVIIWPVAHFSSCCSEESIGRSRIIFLT